MSGRRSATTATTETEDHRPAPRGPTTTTTTTPAEEDSERRTIESRHPSIRPPRLFPTPRMRSHRRVGDGGSLLSSFRAVMMAAAGRGVHKEQTDESGSGRGIIK